MRYRWEEGRPDALGLRLDGRGGANIAVWSAHAERIELCLFDARGRETARLPLPERTGAVWHGRLSDIGAGRLYGLRAHGPWDPGRGHRFNPRKLLLDPCALAVTGDPVWSDALRAHPPEAPDAPHMTDSAAAMPKCVAVEAPAPADPEARPRTPWSDTVIYEAHVRALTKLHPEVPRALRGTYEALGHGAVIDHLKRLGVTALELLPCQAFMDEPHLTARGLRNHWGYNPYAHFAPSPRYMGPNGAAGLRAAIARLHAGGIEVILDVVYNHTAEGDDTGPVLSLRGLDDAGYYRHAPGAPGGGYVNDTGCGNTLSLARPGAQRLALDSLRWWAEVIGVDGFRFDLAPVLGRGLEGAWHPDATFLRQVSADPVLAARKLIAEPWDIGPGGYALGEFPPGWAEWNDRFRDSTRRFWKGDPGGAHELASGLLGSAELFDHHGRPAWSSVNFVAAHDGFTLADQTMYARRRNQANGEGGRDGHAHEVADPMGPEGPGDAAQEAARARRRRNLMLSVFAAQGVPMLRAGDEAAQSQGGNNNAYCQDNATTWIDWAAGDADLLAFARAAAALRARLPALRQRRFLHGERRADGLAEAEWHGLDGGEPDWQADAPPGFMLLIRGAAAPGAAADPTPVCLAFNAAPEAAALRLPPPAPGLRWAVALDTGAADGTPAEGLDPARLPGATARVFEAVPEASALARLADRMGVLARYHEVDGTLRETGDDTRRALLRAMGVEAATEAAAARALAAREAADAARRLPAEAVVSAEAPGAFPLPPLAWRLRLEDGSAREGAAGEPLPALPAGLHALEVAGEETLLAAAPPRAPSVAEVAGRRRVWGVAAALYGLVSARGLARGDYADLGEAARALAGLGADFLGINPVHALGAAHAGISPYSPSSRTAFDTRAIALDRVPEFAACAAAREMPARAAEELAAARAAPLTDPDLHARLHGPALRALFETFEARGDPARRADFAAWLEAGGPARRRFATYEALSLAHGEDWRDWPAALQDPASDRVAAFAAANADEVRFHAWAQWVAQEQLAGAQRAARAAGMGLGLYLDIAVGVRPGGAEAWAQPEAFARGVSLGAPPDALNAQGQVWALAPWAPEGMRRLRYAPFREMLRASMARAGAVRIDHVMGLDRAFWVPRDGAPGGYVRHPREMLLALVRIEAARAGCVVVGEDLGTVPEGLRERLDAAGLHGCAVLQFEGGPEGFRPPRDWPLRSLAAFGTHDTPTLAGWWAADDVGLRLSLGHMTPAGAEAARAERAGARSALCRLLAAEGLAPEGLDPETPPERLTPELREAAHALLAGAGSALMAMTLDDAWGETAQQNVPGTVTEAPNWRRRHRVAPEALGEDPELRRLAAAIGRARGA